MGYEDNLSSIINSGDDAKVHGELRLERSESKEAFKTRRTEAAKQANNIRTENPDMMFELRKNNLYNRLVRTENNYDQDEYELLATEMNEVFAERQMDKRELSAVLASLAYMDILENRDMIDSQSDKTE